MSGVRRGAFVVQIPAYFQYDHHPGPFAGLMQFGFESHRLRHYEGPGSREIAGIRGFRSGRLILRGNAAVTGSRASPTESSALSYLSNVSQASACYDGWDD